MYLTCNLVIQFFKYFRCLYFRCVYRYILTEVIYSPLLILSLWWCCEKQQNFTIIREIFRSYLVFMSLHINVLSSALIIILSSRFPPGKSLPSYFVKWVSHPISVSVMLLRRARKPPRRKKGSRRYQRRWRVLHYHNSKQNVILNVC